MNIFDKYFPEISPESAQKLCLLKPLYEEWNSKINVVSRKDIENFELHHVLHSLGIAKVIEFVPGTSILDIGTGGGFPGIPLAIMFPECHFTLVDSIGKKITVVKAVAEELGLQNVTALHNRAEDIKTRFDFVVSRAVASISDLLPWTHNKFRKSQLNALPNGILLLKGGDLRMEIKESRRSVAEYDLKDYFKEDFFETKKVLYLKMV